MAEPCAREGGEAVPVVNKADDARSFGSGDDWAVDRGEQSFWLPLTRHLSLCLSRSVRTPQLHIALKQATLLSTAVSQEAREPYAGGFPGGRDIDRWFRESYKQQVQKE